MSDSSPPVPPTKLRDRIFHRSVSSDSLKQQWAEKKVSIPRMPFFFINLYQFFIPLWVIVGVDYAYLWCMHYFQILWWIQILLFPGVLLGNYALLIWVMSKACKGLHWYWNKKSPEREGVYSREFTKHNVADPAVQYYHLRGFMYKLPVWVAKKSPFPWLVCYVLRDMAANRIHKNAFYGDAYVALELSTVKDGAAIFEGVCLSSHVVDSIYGNLTLSRVTLEENAVLDATAVMAPGSIVTKGMTVGPKSMVTKNMVIRHANRFIWGIPAKKSEYRSILDRISPDLLARWKEHQQKYKKLCQSK